MTPVDLRVKFKMDTSEYPFWHPTGNLFVGKKFKSTYGLWLEEQLGDLKKLREEFFNSHKIWAVYRTRNIKEYLNQEYIQWLEEKMINEYN